LLPVAILAGGLGTRLLPLTNRIPKALVPVLGRPFLDHQLALLYAQGVRRVVFCLSYLGELIAEHVGDGSAYGIEVSYSYDGAERIGTAGAIKNALQHLGDRFFVVYGDSYLECDYDAIETYFERSGACALMTVYRNENRLAPSNVRFADGSLLAYDKAVPSGEMHHIDFGLSAFHARAFDAVRGDEPTDLGSVIQDLLARGELVGYEVPKRFYEVGTPKGVAELEMRLNS
jgi:NDP-sugar pyrophosphorylase family protein